MGRWLTKAPAGEVRGWGTRELVFFPERSPWFGIRTLGSRHPLGFPRLVPLMATLQGITTTVCISPRRAQGQTICLRPPTTINPAKTLKHFEWPEVGKALYMQLIFHLNGSDSSQIRSPSLYDFHSKAIEDASTPKKWYAPETASNRGGKSLIYGSMIHRKLNNYSNRTIHSSLYTSLSYTHRPTTFSLWAKTLLKSVT